MSNTANSIILIIVTTIVTVLLRGAPFIIFSGKRRMPENAKKVADLIPPSIMAVLVVYCIKSDILGVQTAIMTSDFSGISGAVSTVVALAAVVAVHLWKRQTLFSIATGTAVYMVLIRVLPGIM